jgi:hypothetical protein
LNHAMVQGQLAPSRVAVRVCFQEFKFKHASFYVLGLKRAGTS